MPVATFAIGEAGAVNAALFAVAMLAAVDAILGDALIQFRALQTQAAQRHEAAGLNAPTAPASPPMSPRRRCRRAWLGMMGGGQLGRMFCMAAQAWATGSACSIRQPDSPGRPDRGPPPAGRLPDDAALAEMAAHLQRRQHRVRERSGRSLARLAQDCRVTPAREAVSMAQDRIAEKRFVESCGVPVAPYRAILAAGDLDRRRRRRCCPAS